MIGGFRVRLRDLCANAGGVTVVEFGMVAPVMCLLLMGAFDVSHTLYTRAVLQGVVQKSARDSSLESGTEAASQAALDAKVTAQAKAMNSGATVTITRRFYRTFTEAAAARAESFTDTNGNLTCDANEPYVDANGNSVWDKDGGNAGQGGAKDATLYTVRMTYPRIVPVIGFIGLGNTQTITAQTVLENQPYGDQQSYATPVVRNCA